MRTFIGLTAAMVLLVGSVGVALAAVKSSDRASNQCSRFHMPKAAEAPRALDYSRVCPAVPD